MRIVSVRMIGLAGLLMAVIAADVDAQVDDRLSRLGENPQTTGQVFAWDLYPDGPVGIDSVEEVRQQQQPPRYVATLRNRSDATVASYTLAALVVERDGRVKHVEVQRPVKNVKPNQSRRQEVLIRGAIVSISDRVVFVATDVVDDTGTAWNMTDLELRTRIKELSQRWPRR